MEAASETWYDEDVATFGDRLAAAREAAGMTQEALSKRIGVKLTTLRKWEQDLSEPRANKLQMTSGILGVSIPWLLIGDGDGIDAPDVESTDADALALLSELRDVRTALIAKAEHVGRLEKKLRKLIQDGRLG